MQQSPTIVAHEDTAHEPGTISLLSWPLSLTNLVHVDGPVSGSSEEHVAICAPCERHAPRDATFRLFFGEQLIKYILVFKVPNFDGSVCRRNKPIILRAESECIDRATR